MSLPVQESFDRPRPRSRFTRDRMSPAGSRLAAATSLALAVACLSAPGPAGAQAAMCNGQVATIVGTAGNNTLTGTAGTDVIAGLGGADVIRGLAGDDVICGDGGSDDITPGDGDDTVDGGTGSDRVLYVDHSAGVTVSLLTDVGGSVGESDSIVGIESLTGGAGPDNLTGDDGAFNSIFGADGDDTIFGLSGFDIISGDGGDDTIDGGAGDDEIQGGIGNDALDGGDGTDTVVYYDHTSNVSASLTTGMGGSAGESDRLVGFESLSGGSGADSLTGDASSNAIFGWDGNDTIRGGAGVDGLSGGNDSDTIYGEDGNDTIVGDDGDDALDGGADDDSVYYSDRTSAVTASLDAGFGGSAGESDSIVNFEGLEGGIGPDVLIGDARSNEIQGGEGDDTVIGGLGGDRLYGGAGVDTASYEDHSGAVTASLDSGLNGSAGEYDHLFSDFENLEGGSGPDVLTGDAGPNAILGGAGDDTLSGMAGDDRLDGGIGFDTVSYADAPSVSASLATQLGGRPGEADSLLNAEALTGGPGADSLTGDGADNRLDGGPGDDALDGGPGTDALAGAAGADRLTGGTGNDTLDGGPDPDTFTAGDGDDLLEARDGIADSAFDCGPGVDTLHRDSPADDAIARAGCELPAPPPPPPPPPPPVTLGAAATLPPALPDHKPVCPRDAPSRGWCGDGRPARDARLAAPSDVAVADDGSIVIADTLNNVIRLMRRNGRIYRIAGTGAPGMRNDTAGRAQFDTPAGVATWPGRGVLVADTGNDAIRLIDPLGRVSTLVASQGLVRRRLQRPRDVLGLPDGRLLIADTGGHQVLEMSREGKISVLVGNGTEGYSGDGLAARSARLSNPSQVELEADGSLLIADTGNGAIRRVTNPGTPSATISTVIRDLDGPRGVLGLPRGNVLVGDDSRLILVIPGKRPITVAGARQRGYKGVGPARTWRFNAIGQLADSRDGLIVIPERGNNTVGFMTRPTGHTTLYFARSANATAPTPSADRARLRRPPLKELYSGIKNKGYEDYGNCLDDFGTFRFELWPSGDSRKPLKHDGGKLAFKTGVRANVVLALYRGTRPRPGQRGSIVPVGSRKGKSTTRRLGVGKGTYDAVLWGLSRNNLEIRCDVRPMKVSRAIRRTPDARRR